nr:unnamed protein product [Callosobruchus chinensis]
MIRNVLKERVIDKDTKHYFDSYELHDDKLYKKQEVSKPLCLAPYAFRWQICKLCHDDNGYFVLKKTLKKIWENYRFAKTHRFVKEK